MKDNIGSTPPEISFEHRSVLVASAMHELSSRVELFAGSDLHVLVLGETGVGKELVAEQIHRFSARRERELVKVNCASLTDTIVESELFGHERGAFTGAFTQRVGLFEAADAGTLFLDELAELPLRTQAKLLRVLETGEITRVGGTRVRRLDIRIVAATHQNLARLVKDGSFREDLYFRLSGVTLRVPPLRERTEDIIPLAEHFIEMMAKRLGRCLPALSDTARQVLQNYAWPGNVRELKLVMERAVVASQGQDIAPEHLEFPFALPAPPETVTHRDSCIRERVRDFERERILQALQQTCGNQSRAAMLLGISRRTLTNKLNAHGIDRPRKRTLSPPPPGARTSRSSVS